MCTTFVYKNKVFVKTYDNLHIKEIDINSVDKNLTTMTIMELN